jgi:hypothetical protein
MTSIFLAIAHDSFRGRLYTGKKRRIQVNGMLKGQIRVFHIDI